MNVEERWRYDTAVIHTSNTAYKYQHATYACCIFVDDHPHHDTIVTILGVDYPTQRTINIGRAWS